MKILGIDPGINNFAYSLITDVPQPTVLFSGHLKNTIQNIAGTNLLEQSNKYIISIEELIKKAELDKKDKIVIERYHSRGFRNNQTELVNIMIGCLISKMLYQTVLVLPVTWKNHVKNNYGTNKMSSLIKGLASNHVKDSIGIASYFIEKTYKLKILDHLMKYPVC